MPIQRINPESMHHNPAFDQGTVVEAGSRLLFIGGQNGVGADGQLVAEDTRTQTEQALRNLLTVLTTADPNAGPANVASMRIHLAPEADFDQAFAAAGVVWGAQPTAITVLRVAGLGRPGFHVEIDAVAALDPVRA